MNATTKKILTAALITVVTMAIVNRVSMARNLVTGQPAQ